MDTKQEHQQQNHSSKNWYDKSYKWLLIIPALMLIFSIVYLINFNSKNGDIFYKDVSLTGGTTITVFDENVNIDEIEVSLKTSFPDIHARGISDIRTGKQEGFFVETKAEAEIIKAELESVLGYELNNDNSSIEFSGSTLSSGFYKQLRLALLIAFALMTLVVFAIFRTPVRSLSIVIAGLSDIIMTICVIDLLGMQLSAAGIVALLMLIGYSVDVDILLTTRVFKSNEGTLNERIYDAFKTGMTMTITAIAAVGVALIFTHSFSPVLSQMFTIILIGLGFDIINCWITNASILKWYMEGKN
ncbi:MAG: protein translocase subunit SecF [Nanoarchaeota archaeon]|nr:protein translocase subunit SecF [Nanoarchaeota archaeon]